MQTNKELLDLAFARREKLQNRGALLAASFKSYDAADNYEYYLFLAPDEVNSFLEGLPNGVTAKVWEMAKLTSALKTLDIPLTEDSDAHFLARNKCASSMLPSGFPVTALDVVNFGWYVNATDCIAGGKTFVQITDERTFVFGGVSDITGVKIIGKLGSPIKNIDWGTYNPGNTHLWQWTTEESHHTCLSSDDAPDYPSDIRALADYDEPEDNLSYKLEINFPPDTSCYCGCRSWNDIIHHQQMFNELRKHLSKNRGRIISLGGECPAYSWEKE